MALPHMLQVLFTCCTLLLLYILGIGGITAQAQTQPDAAEIYEILEQGQQYRHSLEFERDRLYQSIKSLNTENDATLYRLADVKLNDFAAFETLVFGMIDIYDRTVHQRVRGDGAAYDFRTPALKLTFDFQLAIKEAHEHLQMHSFDELRKLTQLAPAQKEAVDPQNDAKPTSTYTLHHVHTDGDAPDSREAVKEMLHGMLKEIRENADQLEKGMQQHNLAFPSNGRGATIETVLKLSEDDENGSQDNGEEGAVLIDQDNNQYIMTRPSDTTVIYEDMQLLHDFILIIVTSFIFGWIFSLIGLPSFFGYILAGITMGPSGNNLIKELIQTETLAQLGVVFIVFVLGLEFSMERLRAMWRLALGGAVMILIVTVLLFVIMGAIVGATMKEAIFVGACISLSSTAVVVKCIRLDHLDHLYGLLVMQDVLLGFMLAIMPALSKSGVQVMIAILKISVSFTIFGAVCFGIVRTMPSLRRLLKRFFPNKAVQYSHELMLLGTMAVCLVMLMISDYLGLGMEIGCFAAGVIVRSRKNLFEASLAVIEPVRDLFACLFFASIGLHIYPSFLASEALLLVTLAAAVVGFKYTTTLGVLTFFKLDLRKSSIMAIALAQISEFAFVLASRAKHLNIISREIYYLLLAVTSLTLMSTPLLWKLFDRSSSLPLTSSSSSSSSSSAHHAHNPHHSQYSHHHSHHLHEEYHPVVSVSMDDTAKVA